MEYSEEIFNFLSIVIPSGKRFSAVTNLLTKKGKRLDIISRGDLRLTLTRLTPNVVIAYVILFIVYSMFIGV
ncbi:unnamed protein product [Acanthoscelides obtectus]|uniref:Uncharacterized protein n=1 Tax=Acanthoscelides obtectus TaxID=200917 RepID=A0A9P0KV16_ACAOB|nr:unnamed protein product [Acanthoscelides obtectus]CAK1675350.1 hypothetical protein AOBTE_LOCUS30156 [Acanthoscelides obtectus]